MRRIATTAGLMLALVACSHQQPSAAATASPSVTASGAASASASATAASAGPTVESRFIPFSTCKLVDSNENEDWSTSKCQAVPGWSVFIDYGDARDDVRLGRKGSKELDMDLPTLAGGGFNTLGPMFEWRGKTTGGTFAPHALIVRDSVAENSEHPGRPTSLLAVIDLAKLCLVAFVSPGPQQNRQAQAIADAGNKPCITQGD